MSLKPRKCDVCPKVFIPKSWNQKCCSERCRVHRSNRLQRERNVKNNKYQPVLKDFALNVDYLADIKPAIQFNDFEVKSGDSNFNPLI